MILKNTTTLLLLAFFTGIATNLGLIGAQSYLLSYADAVYTVLDSIIAGLAFSYFLKSFSRWKFKYSHFAVISLLAYTVLSLVLVQPWLSGFPKAILWFFVAVFGFDLLRWINSELNVRYLDPARAHSYFSYLNAFMEGGTVVIVIFLRLRGIILDANQTLSIIIFCCLMSAVLVAWRFLSKTSFEIVYSQPIYKDTNKLHKSIKPIISIILIMTAAFAAIEVGEDYLVKIVVKDQLQNYSAIRAITDSYFSCSCALIVLFSALIGKAIEVKRISPITLLKVYAMVMAGFSILCIVLHNFYLFIVFEIARRVAEYCLYSPGNQMILSSFLSELRPWLKAQHGLVYYVVVPMFLACLFACTEHLSINSESMTILCLVLTSAIAAVISLYYFKKAFTNIMYRFVDSGQKATAIIAAHALSYIRPNDYVQRMIDILKKAPKKLLRKTIVLGLAYTQSEDSVEIIKQQFESDKEEIQIAALDALRISKRFRATQLMLNILQDKARPKTQRVRINAMSAIAGIYGKKSIPLLLNGLEDSDPRIVANALEVLSQFNDRDLKPYFLKYVHSDVPRVKANSLLGLAHYHDTRKLYQNTIKESLHSNNLNLLSSVLYVIGQLKDRKFRADTLQIYNNLELRNSSLIVNSLAWALIRLNQRQGFDLTNQILLLPNQAKEHAGFIHFFSLYQPELRFDIIKYFVASQNNNIDAIQCFGSRLKGSIYDFHEELDFLKSCSLNNSLESPKTTTRSIGYSEI